MKSAFLALLFAAACTIAAASPCDNCHGARVVGPGPVRFACPVCGGSGEAATPLPPSGLATPAGGESRMPAAAAPGPRPAVARLEARVGDELHGGSGVLVAVSGSHGLVVTNWHVVRSVRDSVTVHWPDGNRGAGRVLKTDQLYDLAAVLVPRPAAEPVTIAAQAPRVGDRLTIAGYGGRPYVYREESGALTEYLTPGRGGAAELIECRATARKGDSGGPIFNADGQLAGVLFGANQGETVGPCSTRVRTFLAGVRWPGAECADGRCAAK
jgi:hypothetical protein